MTGSVGIILNTRAGQDLRRLATDAPSPTGAQRGSDLRRMIVGALENGAARVLVPADRGGVVERALRDFSDEVQLLEIPATSSGDDTARAAAALRGAAVDVVLVSGGDGTHRDVARGWRDAPIVARAAGTNNAFGQPIEATMAGAAAGLVASTPGPIDDLVAYQALTIDIDIEGDPRDLALVSVAVLRDDLTGSGSVWRVDGIDQVLATVAEPWSVGLSALAGVVAPTSRTEDRGVLLDLAADEVRRVRAATAPGWFVDAGLRSVSSVACDQPVAVRGPGVFVVDGERGPMLGADEWASMTVRRNGPRVIDIRRTFSIAVRQSRFYRDPSNDG